MGSFCSGKNDEDPRIEKSSNIFGLNGRHPSLTRIDPNSLRGENDHITNYKAALYDKSYFTSYVELIKLR